MYLIFLSHKHEYVRKVFSALSARLALAQYAGQGAVIEGPMDNVLAHRIIGQ